MTEHAHRTTQNNDSIIAWLDRLREIVPPCDVTVIGAGDGQGPWVRWLLDHESDAALTFVEADEGAAGKLHQRVGRTDPALGCANGRASGSVGRRVLHATVAAHAGPVEFFSASLETESGLIDPEALRGFWPNLRRLATRSEETRTLAELLADEPRDAGPDSAQSAVRREDQDGSMRPARESRWLVIDCLPAAALLAAASARLADLDLVLVRALLGVPEGNHASVPNGASLDAVREVLAGASMRLIALQPGRHPGIGHALFVRDPRASLRLQAQGHSRKLRELRKEQAARVAEHEASKEHVLALREDYAATFKLLVDARAALRAEQQARAADIAALRQEQDFELSTASAMQDALQGELAASRKQAAALANQLREQQTSVQALNEREAQLRRERDAGARAEAKALAALRATEDAHAGDMAKLQARNAELSQTAEAARRDRDRLAVECDTLKQESAGRAQSDAVAREALQAGHIAELAGVQAELERLRRAVTEHGCTLAAEQALQAELRAALERERSARMASEEAADAALQAVQAEHASRLAGLEASRAQLARRLEQAQDEHMAKLALLRQDQDAQARAVAAARDALAAAKQGWAGRLATLERERDTYAQSQSKARAALRAAQTAHASEAAGLRARNRDLARSLEKAQAEYARLDEALTALRQDRAERDPASDESEVSLQAAHAAHEEMKEQLAASRKETSKLQQRIRKLQAEQERSTESQGLLQEELQRAGAQIDLIKDLLLPEVALRP